MSGTRQASKIRTRNRLVRSAIRLLHRSGVTSLTTGKIASEAGVAQPTFYVHFEDMKALLNEVASQISATIITRMQPVRETVMSEPSRRTVREACEMSVRALVEDPRFADLYLRHRRDVDTPLGKRFGELTKMARAVLREELLRARSVELAVEPGVDQPTDVIVVAHDDSPRILRNISRARKTRTFNIEICPPTMAWISS